MKFGSTLWRGLREIFSARNEPEHMRLITDLYWRALLTLAFLVLVLVFSYSTWGLLRILNDLGEALDTSAPPPPALNRAELSAAIRVFQIREDLFEDLKTNPPAPINDPSI